MADQCLPLWHTEGSGEIFPHRQPSSDPYAMQGCTPLCCHQAENGQAALPSWEDELLEKLLPIAPRTEEGEQERSPGLRPLYLDQLIWVLPSLHVPQHNKDTISPVYFGHFYANGHFIPFFGHLFEAWRHFHCLSLPLPPQPQLQYCALLMNELCTGQWKSQWAQEWQH